MDHPLTVRARDLANQRIIEMEITAAIPVQRMLTIEDLRWHFPKSPTKPQSRRTIMRWIKAGRISVFKMGNQLFADPKKLPSAD